MHPYASLRVFTAWRAVVYGVRLSQGRQGGIRASSYSGSTDLALPVLYQLACQTIGNGGWLPLNIG
jgi:hypothetical protein